MSIFQKFKEYNKARAEKRILKAGKTIKNAKAIKEDRWAALEFLAALDDPEKAVPVLLDRFEYSLEHGINDTREKELAMNGIINHKDKAIPYVKDKIKSTTRIAWPMKIIQEIGDEGLVIEILKEGLNFGEVSFDQSAVDKNYDILCYLRDYQLTDYISELSHFLKDLDERVRFACVEVLIEQNDPSIPALLEPFLKDDSSENRRIKQSIVQAFIKNGWPLKDPSVFEDGNVDQGVVVNKKGFLERTH